jgi:hypothetical protein
MENEPTSLAPVQRLVGRMFRDKHDFINFNMTGIQGMEELVLGNMKLIDSESCQFCGSKLFLPEIHWGDETSLETFEEEQEIVCKKCGVVKIVEMPDGEDFCIFKELEKPKSYEWCNTKATANAGKFLIEMVNRCDAETVVEYLRLCVHENDIFLDSIENVIFSPMNPPNVRDNRAGPGDQVKAESAPVAGSGASTCWADFCNKCDKPKDCHPDCPHRARK